MNTTDISIVAYNKTDAPELLRLLVVLQVDYYKKVASKELQELHLEVDPVASYQRYIDLINSDQDDNWKVFLARTLNNETVGFIIGNVTTDEDLVKPIVGKIEDWIVLEEYRASGVGLNLYKELESWFKAKGCTSLASSTWPDNEVSIKMHQKLGFITTEVCFGKPL